jgi:hypothetical protein
MAEEFNINLKELPKKENEKVDIDPMDLATNLFGGEK